MNHYLQTKDFSVSQEQFKLEHNLELDMLITKPVPGNLDSYYESDSYISHTDADTSFVDKIYQTVKKYSLRKKIKLIDIYNRDEKKLLDVGCGTGDFLIAAYNNNWNVCGVEPNENARRKAIEKGLQINTGIDELLEKKYDVITLWHVLEHLPNVSEKIKKIKNLLVEDGTLIIAVPNFKSYDATHYKKYWAAYDVPRHLSHFSKTSINKLFQKENMEIINIKPMLFDSFYVSLLSEKYKNGRQNYFKAFLVGLYSNIRAIKTKEHSSLIYIIKNK